MAKRIAANRYHPTTVAIKKQAPVAMRQLLPAVLFPRAREKYAPAAVPVEVLAVILSGLTMAQTYRNQWLQR